MKEPEIKACMEMCAALRLLFFWIAAVVSFSSSDIVNAPHVKMLEGPGPSQISLRISLLKYLKLPKPQKGIQSFDFSILRLSSTTNISAVV